MNGEPSFRKVNPLNITVLLDDDSNFVDDAIAVIEERLLSIPTILDEFGDDLKSSDVDALLKMSNTGTAGYTGDIVPYYQFANYNQTNPSNRGSGENIRVVRVEWFLLKSRRFNIHWSWNRWGN